MIVKIRYRHKYLDDCVSIFTDATISHIDAIDTMNINAQMLMIKIGSSIQHINSVEYPNFPKKKPTTAKIIARIYPPA